MNVESCAEPVSLRTAERETACTWQQDSVKRRRLDIKMKGHVSVAAAIILQA